MKPVVVPASSETSTDYEPVLAAARGGDAAAFAALYRRFAPIAHGIAIARVGPSDADDVVQETFVALHGAMADLRDGASLPGWIRTVAANVSVDKLRRRARSPAALDAPDALPARDGVASDGDDATLRARVLARLQQLPEPYRETLVWRLVEGLTGPEIATRTGLTPGSVRVNLCRGMALLRPLLQKDGWR